MVTNVPMRLEWELELASRPRVQARNHFIRENLEEICRGLRVVPHYTRTPSNYRRMSRNKVRR